MIIQLHYLEYTATVSAPVFGCSVFTRSARTWKIPSAFLRGLDQHRGRCCIAPCR